MKPKVTALKETVSKLSTAEGSNPTTIPFLSFLKSSNPTSLRQGVLRPSVCLVVQGQKRIQIGDEVFKYGAGDFVVSVVDLPTTGQIIGANPKNPYLGIVLQIDVQEVASIVLEAGLNLNTEGALGVGAAVGTMDDELLDCMNRMLKLLRSPQESKFFAANLRREIIYRLLTSPQGKNFF
jgi:hypothetical protein